MAQSKWEDAESLILPTEQEEPFLLQQQKNLLEYWKAYVYEQQEDESAIIACMQRLIGREPQRILEIGCGGAKLSASLAQSGHDVTGMDCSSAMLYFAAKRARSLPGLHIRKVDVFTEPWGENYDVVILGNNLMCSIITEWDYKQAQKQLILRSAQALRPGGKLILDFDCPDTLAAYGVSAKEKLYFEGNDDHGSKGRYFVCGHLPNEKTRMVKSSSRTEIFPAAGMPFQAMEESTRHFPTLAEVCTWLYREGFSIESLHGEPFDQQHRRAVILARKE